MTAYYNEIDKYAAQWLRNLIDDGQIAPGYVDERSIEDVYPSDLRGFTQCHFFAGLGGWSYALRLAGWTDDRPVWTGSCPCQPFSAAGKGVGFADERHLWPYFHHLIKECRPTTIFGEQVASSAEWVELMYRDLEGVEYSVGAMPIEAASAGAPHRRDRFWWHAADTKRNKQPRKEPCVWSDRRMGRELQLLPWDGGWQQALARFRVMDYGIPRCVEATDAARNAIVPQVAQVFIESVMDFTC